MKITASKLFLAFAVLVLSGCLPNNSSISPQAAISQSEKYYQEGIAGYKKLIAEGKDTDNLYFKLGQVYFGHGEFDKAIEQFKKSNNPEARKYLGIAYFNRGNFVDALDTFAKVVSPDDQANYYHGLTAEKLNLFDQATSFYQKIKAGRFLLEARLRISEIEKQGRGLKISQISPEIAKLIQRHPALENYPEAGTLVLLCDERVRITKENTEISQMHYLIQVLNQRGKEDCAETGIEYDSTFEKVELEYARTIKPDGTVVDVGSRHIRDVSKYMNFPLYSNARVYIISFPEIAENAVIEYKYKITRNKLVNDKDFVTAYPLKGKDPILKARFELVVPKDRQLRFKIINEQFNDSKAKLEPQVSQDNDDKIYSWDFKDIPQIVPEPDMPDAVKINPTIMISSFSGWDSIYKWWQGLSADKIKPDKDISEKTLQLVKGKKTAREKAAAIYEFCSRKIRYVAVEYGQAGYQPHQAADIFSNKYGDCKDKAILLVTMLRLADLQAYPVLIPTEELYDLDKEFPSMIFNHAIAAVMLGKEMIFMDPTCEACSFADLPSADQGRNVLVFTPSEYTIVNTPLSEPQHNYLQQKLSIKINPDETITAKRTVVSSGVYAQAQRYWLWYTSPELIAQTLRGKIQGISIGAQLIDYKFQNLEDLSLPARLEYDFRGSEYLTLAGDMRILPQFASVDVSIVAQEKRMFDIQIGFLSQEDVELEVDIPKGFVVKYMPDCIKKESPWFDLDVQYKIQSNRIYFKQSSIVKQRKISQGQYGQFKKFIQDLAQAIKQRIVLEKAR
ncbi:MAG: DUF3857 domain-containing protein [Candidatus Omnitrophica bacterium]|jgi:hypothetical protein|nr:DUF3857 domain-containing protein [Candidatus Omnitrophota bacterium]